MLAFLSTLSLRRATVLVWCFCGGACDFYPRSPCGERRYSLRYSASRWHFYPRSPCGERLGFCDLEPIRNAISIHALLAESDFEKFEGVIATKISIHALLAESDTVVYNIVLMPREFLSTLSLRRATLYSSSSSTPAVHFYPRSPCGERPPITFRHCTTYLFLSTLSLRRATDLEPSSTRRLTFLSTLSLRRATRLAPRS